MTLEEIAIKLTEHHKEIGSLKHRVDDLEENTNTIHELVISVKELALNIKSMIHEQERIAKSQERAFQRIEVLEKKPAKRWESVVTVLITVAVTAIVTYCLSRIGL